MTTEAIAQAITAQMSPTDIANFTPQNWRDGISAMLVDGWEGADLDGVLDAIEDDINDSGDNDADDFADNCWEG